MIDMADLSLDEIASRIVDAIMAQPFIHREKLIETITPVLKIWIKQTDKYKKTGVARIDKLQITIQSRDVQQKYWLNKFKEIIGPEQMQQYYDELDEILTRDGYK